MRIAIDARFIGATSYGLAQYSESLLAALAELDATNEYTVFVGAGLKRRLKVGQNFRVIPIKGRPLSAKGIARISLALRRGDYDLLHVHFPLAPLAVDIPTVITVHDAVPFQRAAGRGPDSTIWDRIGGWVLYPMTMRNAQWVLCVSQATRANLCSIFPDVFHKTIVVASGVEEQYRKKAPSDLVLAVQARLKLPRRYVLYSGSSVPSKNVPSMIRAFAMMKQSDARAQEMHFVLDIQGDRRGLETIRRAMAAAGMPSFIHSYEGLTTDERLAVFSKASALFLASREEGFGFPAIRAQLCGVPVVAADSGALPEVCGEGALMVDPDNLEEMATMLGRALFDEDLREYLKDKGLKNADRFSWAGTAKHVKQIYELLF